MDHPPRLVRSLLYLLFGVCPLLFFTDLTRNPYYTQIALLNIILPACWLVWLWQAWKNKELVWVTSGLDRPLLLLIAVSAAAWGWSWVIHAPLRSPVYSEGSRGFIFLIVNTYLAYAAALRSQDRVLMKRFLWIIYATAVAASVYGVAQYFGTEWFWPHSLSPYGSRPVSTFGNPNFMSSYLLMVIAVMMADYLFKATGMPRVFLFAGILVSLGALLATLTRSSWAGLLVAGAIVSAASLAIPETRAQTQKWLGALVLAVALAGIFWPKSDTSSYSATVAGRLTEIKELAHGGYAPVSQRLLIWLSAWTMVEDHPVLGKGWGCFELFYPFYQGSYLLEKDRRGLRTHANNAHNEILEYWSQIGTLGLGCVVLLWIVFFRLTIQIARRLPSPWKAIEWGFIGGVAGMLVDNLLNVSVHFAVPALLFWWWVGSAFVMDPAALSVRRVAIRGPWRTGALALAGVTLACFMARSACLWEEEVNFFTGFKLSKGGADLAAARRSLETAYAWHHLEVNNNYELGNVYARLNQKDQALFMYQRALDANAGYDEIYFNRATLLMQMNRVPEAIASYRTCLGINPLSHEAYNALATLYMRDLAHYGDATETLYLQGIRAFPEDKDMWNNIGYLYTQRKQWPKAIDAYQKALQLDPSFELAKRNLAVVSHEAAAR